MKIHLDTDLGGDPDDACALAMLLGWPGVELVGITTNLDRNGRRAGMVAQLLKLAGRDEIPVAAGATGSLTTLSCYDPKSDDALYWGRPISPAPSPPGAALDLLQRSIGYGATIVAIGAFTNLALLEVCRPGILGDVPVVAMGGWVEAPTEGLPDWGPEMDWNVQCDTRAAQILTTTAQLTLVTLPVTLKAHLRAAHLPRLQRSGPLGELLSCQLVEHSKDHEMPQLARAHTGLPDDLLNFHYDPVTCAVAVGWPGAVVEDMDIQTLLDGDILRFERSKDGRHTDVVVDIDGADFTEIWLKSIEAAQRDS